MSDYKELIGDIRICLIAQPNQTLYKQLLREAANAIVQLVEERDEWKTLGSLANKRAEDYREMRRQRDKAIKERDAAVADLTVFDKCKICKHYDERSANYGYTEFCENCGAYPWADDEEPNKWEWRGVQEVEHE